MLSRVFNNGGTIPFGYMIDETRHYQPDPLLAPYVEQAFQKYADGATMTDLRDWLKAHNIKNSMGGELEMIRLPWFWVITFSPDMA